MLSRLFDFSKHRDTATRRKVRNITFLSTALIVVGVLFAVVVPPFSETSEVFWLIAIIGVFLAGSGLAVLWLASQTRLQDAERLIYAAVVIPSVVLTFSPAATYDTAVLVWIGASVFVLAISGPRGVLLYGMLGMVGIPLSYLLREDSGFTVVNMLSAVVVFLGVNAVCWILSNDLMVVIEEVLSQASDRRLRLIETTSAVSSRIFSRLELETLLSETVEVIRDQFAPIYHAQVFLIDANRTNAILRASTGEVGRRLIRQQHQLPVGSQSVIGQVTLEGEYVMASDTSVDAIHRRNELLPDTRTELALPLRVRDEVIGALDLQSLMPNAFDAADIEIFQTLADQIAIAIENARLVEEAQAAAAENLRLLQQEQSNRQEIERLNQELVGRAWQRFLREQVPVPRQTVDLESGQVVDSAEQTPSMTRSKQSGEVVIDTYSEGKRIAVPINVRGAAVGLIEFDVPGDEPISSSLQVALTTISERLGIIAENTRLFETAQAAVNYQEQLNQISSSLQGRSTVDELLGTALSTLSKTMAAETAYIRLVTKDGGDIQQDGMPSGDDEWVEVS